MERTLLTVHAFVGFVPLALAALALVIAVPAALRGLPPPSPYRPLHRLVAALVLAQVAYGGVLLATGQRPRDVLHLVYGAAAVLVMPLARAMARRERGRARAFEIGGTLLLLGVLFRLATTG